MKEGIKVRKEGRMCLANLIMMNCLKIRFNYLCIRDQKKEKLDSLMKSDHILILLNY